MKKTFLNRKLIVLLFLLVVGFCNANSQESKIYLVAGASMPDLFHAGLGFHLYEYVALNVKLGTAFSENYGFWGTYSLGSDLSFYFGKKSQKRKTKLWAFNSGITYLKDKSAAKKWKYIYSDSSISYDFYLLRNLIFQPELGVLFQLSKEEEEKPDYNPGWFGTFDVDLPVLPVIGAKLKILL